MPGSMVPRGQPLRVLRTVQATLARHAMLGGGETVVVAVSGGPDSMALLHLLRTLAPTLRLRLSVAHVSHGLHRASASHAAFVRRMATAWDLPVTIEAVDVRAFARRHHLTMEDAARQVRYATLTRVARRRRATRIAVAHTADDQVETVLLWLVRGASTDGLAGMPAVRRLGARPQGAVSIIRPLIDLWRRDVMSYVRAAKVPFRVDPTNRSRRPLRNRIRQDLLPALEGYNPGIKAVLRRLAEQAADDAGLLGRQADDAAAAVIRRDGQVTIDARVFRTLPVSLQRRVGYRAFAQAGGNIRGLAFVHIERLRAMADRGLPGERADLPGLRAQRIGDRIVLTRTRAHRSSRGRMLQ